MPFEPSDASMTEDTVIVELFGVVVFEVAMIMVMMLSNERERHAFLFKWEKVVKTQSSVSGETKTSDLITYDEAQIHLSINVNEVEKISLSDRKYRPQS